MLRLSHFTLLALRHSDKHSLQSLLLILGVALGVALIVGIDMANQSAHQAFVLSTGSVTNQATHQIVAGSGGLPTALYEDLRLELGLRDTAPVVTGRVRLKNARNAYLQLLGIDPAAELSIVNYLGEQDDGASLAALAHLLLTPDGVALAQSLCEQYQLALGDNLTVVINGQHKYVKLAAMLETNDEVSRRALAGLMISDISTAQVLLDKVGRIDYIDLKLPAKADTQPIVDRLPAKARLQPAELQTQAITQMVESLELSLSIASQLVLLAGMFLIYNTISFSVVQQRPVLGVLRCLGVTRREIFGLVLTEALVLGIAGSIIGLGLGILLGRTLVGVVAGTIGEFYRLTVQKSLWGSPLILYKGMVAGLVASLLAAFIPALEATTIPPHNVLQRSQQESRLQRLMPGLTGGGALLLAAGWSLLYYPGKSLLLGFTAIFTILAGFVLLTPLFTQLFMRLLHPLTRWSLGLIGRMGPRDILRALSRTSIAIAALMLVISIIVAVGLVIDSFRDSITVWLENTIRADIYIMSMDRNALDPYLVEELAAMPGVVQVSPIWEATVVSPDYGLVTVRAVDPLPDEDKMPVLWSLGDYRANAAALAAGDVVVTEAFARYHHLPLDQPSVLTLNTGDGPHPFRVIGIIYDYQSPGAGHILMRPHVYQNYWQDAHISIISLYLTPDLASQTEEVIYRLKQKLSERYALVMFSGHAIKTSIREGFERSFTVTSALRLLAVVVGFFGILSTLMSLQFERTRELGILRANGMSVSQLWGKTLLETGLMGLAAGLMSIPVGSIFSFILVQVVNQRVLGWVVQLRPHLTTFGLALTMSLAAALLAGIYPAFRLSRMKIAAAIREE
ncbi:MAG: ABC transporter permease [Anaerolineae bacterium]|nr:ABC transporter permease [Anaerolineae bacterium]